MPARTASARPVPTMTKKPTVMAPSHHLCGGLATTGTRFSLSGEAFRVIAMEMGLDASHCSGGAWALLSLEERTKSCANCAGRKLRRYAEIGGSTGFWLILSASAGLELLLLCRG